MVMMIARFRARTTRVGWRWQTVFSPLFCMMSILSYLCADCQKDQGGGVNGANPHPTKFIVLYG